MNNIFVSTTFQPDGSSIYEAIDLCHSHGLYNLELGSNHCFEEDYSRLQRQDGRFFVHNYFPAPKDPFVVNIASSDANIRTKSCAFVYEAIEFAEYIGAELYTFHPGFISDPVSANTSTANFDFVWSDNEVVVKEQEQARQRMYESLDQIVSFANGRSLKIAIETEGSFTKSNQLLMQTPNEMDELLHRYRASELGINLNIGHLHLAAEYFGFSKKQFASKVAGRLVAMELSHNDGREDQHLPLEPDGWYWDILSAAQFKDVPKILEFRNSSITRIVESAILTSEKLNAV